MERLLGFLKGYFQTRNVKISIPSQVDLNFAQAAILSKRAIKFIAQLLHDPEYAMI